jgi:hypothetical protein
MELANLLSWALNERQILPMIMIARLLRIEVELRTIPQLNALIIVKASEAFQNRIERIMTFTPERLCNETDYLA